MTIFSVLIAAIFFIFQMGLSAWHKTTTKNELLQQSQLLASWLSRDLQRSSLSSLSSDESAGVAAFLSPLDNNGVFVSDVRGRPVWQEYIVYYLNSSEDVIYRRTIPLVAGAPERSVPTPIEYYNDGGGTHNLPFYMTGGRPVARYVGDFEPKVLPAPISQLSSTIEFERERYGYRGVDTETYTTIIASALRN